MNNLITINFADPIREEYNQAIDKTAALNTIAFKLSLIHISEPTRQP